MSFRADFYLGRDINAEWLGSLRTGGAPCHIAHLFDLATTPLRFVRAVKMALDGGDGVHANIGWPWEYNSSLQTDYTYAFARGRIWVSCYGSPWVALELIDRSSLVNDYDFDALRGRAPQLPEMDVGKQVA